MLGVALPVVVGALGSLLPVVAHSYVWFTVSAGLLVGVTLQIAAAVVAAYLVITTVRTPRPVRRRAVASGLTARARVL